MLFKPQHDSPSLRFVVSACRYLSARCHHSIALPVRNGALQAEDFVREFRQVCGSQPEATAALLDLAALLPTREQQLALQLASQGPPQPRQPASPPGGIAAPMARGQAADPVTVPAQTSATAPVTDSAAAGQAPVAASADYEADADSSVRATAGAVDIGASRAAPPAVDEMLDSSWMASHDSR